MIYFLLPVFNEAENISRVIEKLSQIAAGGRLDYTVVAVDDASTDGSAAALSALSQKHPIRVIRHAANQGPGGAFRTGFEEILRIGQPADAVITMDADNTHSTKTVGMILGALDEGYEVVIASVFAPGGMMIGVPFLRYVLTMGCNFIYRIIFPVRGIREYTGFYRGYNVGCLQEAQRRFGGPMITRPGFGSMAELLVRLRQVPVFMKEVPMIVRYDQKGGKSKMRIMSTISEHLHIIASNAFRRRIL
ncbi:MAG: glycosyltransferase family 2 protein [Elusimicrobiota bacterium]